VHGVAGLGIHGEVRVAEGTYPITAPLVVARGIALRGGYDESGWDRRDIEVYETVLAGSGVEHVVGFAAQAGESTLLEGFVLRAAPATTLKPGGCGVQREICMMTRECPPFSFSNGTVLDNDLGHIPIVAVRGNQFEPKLHRRG